MNIPGPESSPWHGTGSAKDSRGSREKQFDRDEIDLITVKTGVSHIARSMPYSNLILRLRDGRSVVIAKYLPDRGEATWIAERLQERLGEE